MQRVADTTALIRIARWVQGAESVLMYRHKEPALAILILGRPIDEIVDLCNEFNIEIVWLVGDTCISPNNPIFSFGKIKS